MADKKKDEFRKYKDMKGGVTLTRKGSDYDTGAGSTDMANAWTLDLGQRIAKKIDKDEAASGKKGRRTYESVATPRNIENAKQRAKESREENAKKFLKHTQKGLK